MRVSGPLPALADRMRRLLFVGLALAAGLAGTTRTASANGCNLYSSQRWGQIREGCSITVFSPVNVDPGLPTITRGGQELTPTIVQDQILLKVTYEHYPSADSCELNPPEYENQTFNRYVVSWADLHGGDEVLVDNSPYTMVVPGPGDCGVVDPFFYCQDPIQSCTPHDPDPDPSHDDDSDLSGCAAGSHSPGWFALIGVAAFVSCSRRRRASGRR
jgi:hypothetical protein